MITPISYREKAQVLIMPTMHPLPHHPSLLFSYTYPSPPQHLLNFFQKSPCCSPSVTFTLLPLLWMLFLKSHMANALISFKSLIKSHLFTKATLSPYLIYNCSPLQLAVSTLLYFFLFFIAFISPSNTRFNLFIHPFPSSLLKRKLCERQMFVCFID